MNNKKLEELNNQILNKYHDKEIVLGEGYSYSPIVLIGEAPGAKEVELKKPFVGQAGKYLKEFLEILEIKREDIYITNVVKFRPTKESKKTGGKINRPPTEKEIEIFKEFLFAEISIVSPSIIVTLGNTPLKAILGDNLVKIGDFHGKEIKTIINQQSYCVFPLYHPAAVIYNRKLKETYLEDLNNLKRVLNRGVSP